MVLAPVQAPEAVQDVALAELQDRVLLAPEAIDVGLADRETVGAVGGGGGGGVVPPKGGKAFLGI